MADDFQGFPERQDILVFKGFDIASRGYDRAQVDAFLASLTTGSAPGAPPVFDIVRRGYDRVQVDARIAQLLSGGPGR
ncbi:DivIVA domain-containing protein [Streptomyces sp. FXJ1.172]|uniref:DivIVA domain-containing protein n=1 Tax=Streptomyces sp. FXJ1.172 TaxID=710705 RepID=UPI0007CFD3EC|nr:DivIVA domain-containing protein [Streptomyces sp. FXJ1.172]WEO96585.1 DivIVA domain-containing protein [Streptomyces sp. FXJ1.172]